MKVLKISILLLCCMLYIASCAASDSEYKPIDEGNGPLKLIITNNTDYDVKELYYKIDQVPSYENLGVKLNESLLRDEAVFEFCPSKGGKYYFTFVRQNGSYDTSLYISSEQALYLKPDSGIIKLSLLPFNFHYEVVENYETTCTVNNGK